MTAEAEFRPHLSDQLCRILENAAFMLVENADAPLPEPSPAIQASLRFFGLRNGTCWLVVSEGDAQQLAAEMLGTDQAEDRVRKSCDNATGELLNMLTAWLLDSWWGDDTNHELGIPETHRLPITQTRVWNVPPTDRVIISTDSGCTFLSCVTLD